MKSKPIRCVCWDIDLDTLDHSKPLTQLQQETKVGTKCGLCIPYLEAYLKKRKSND